MNEEIEQLRTENKRQQEEITLLLQKIDGCSEKEKAFQKLEEENKSLQEELQLLRENADKDFSVLKGKSFKYISGKETPRVRARTESNVMVDGDEKDQKIWAQNDEIASLKARLTTLTEKLEGLEALKSDLETQREQFKLLRNQSSAGFKMMRQISSLDISKEEVQKSVIKQMSTKYLSTKSTGRQSDVSNSSPRHNVGGSSSSSNNGDSSSNGSEELLKAKDDSIKQLKQDLSILRGQLETAVARKDALEAMVDEVNAQKQEYTLLRQQLTGKLRSGKGAFGSNTISGGSNSATASPGGVILGLSSTPTGKKPFLKPLDAGAAALSPSNGGGNYDGFGAMTTATINE